MDLFSSHRSRCLLFGTLCLLFPHRISLSALRSTLTLQRRARSQTDYPDTSISLTILRAHAVRAFAQAFQDAVWHGGLLTDELQSPLNGLRRMPPDADTARLSMFTKDITRRWSREDARRLPQWRQSPASVQDNDGLVDHLREPYVELQGARVVLMATLRQLEAAKAAGMPLDSVANVQGELSALLGYTEVLLADLFCAGVPLHTADSVTLADVTAKYWYEKTIDHHPMHGWFLSQAYLEMIAGHAISAHASATTVQVYRSALADFDRALRLGHGNPQIRNLARIGRGRVWLALGAYDSAAAAVAIVPQGFTYRVSCLLELDPDGDEVEATVADREGGNGLPYVSSGDPRTATTWIYTDKVLHEARMPSKYWHDGTMRALPEQPQSSAVRIPIPLASWEESLLIRAEAALYHEPVHTSTPPRAQEWLSLLNQLRATAPIPGTSHPDPARLPALHDPGTPQARLRLLFQERAYWLFLTGHRQGDLRRLVRQYHWPQDHAYPTGPYIVPEGFVSPIGTYGTDVTLPIPPEERLNPLFHGCLDRQA